MILSQHTPQVRAKTEIGKQTASQWKGLHWLIRFGPDPVLRKATLAGGHMTWYFMGRMLVSMCIENRQLVISVATCIFR